MKYSKEEVMQYVAEEDVKFIRLAFCDVFGKQKNISIMPDELPRALLRPQTDTLAPLPWRPEHGRVVRMLCDITYPDGTPFECDTRNLLKKAVADAEAAGVSFSFGAEQEFYLFELDENEEKTDKPYDTAGYMDIAPEDKGENIRREICLTLEQMGISPESSHHEEGPGQNEIDFRYSDALTAADNAQTFQTVVRTVAKRNGLYADFSPKPIDGAPGNGFHINISVKPEADGKFEAMIAGILDHVRSMTAFLDPTDASYRRLGVMKAPGYVSWSHENRSQLVRIPAAVGEYRRAELRSPDPYLAFALMIRAGLDGIKRGLTLPEPADFNLFHAGAEVLDRYKKLPGDLAAAKRAATKSEFIRGVLPEQIIRIFCE